MRYRFIILTVTSAILIFLIKLFEIKFLSNSISIELYITAIGVLFLGFGLYIGLNSHRRKPEMTMDSQSYIKSNSTDLGSDSTLEHGSITSREIEILREVANGLSNKEIAEKLFVSENTIKKHLNNIYSKLGVRRRTQAIQEANRLNLI